jgi:hypothetical protein
MKKLIIIIFGSFLWLFNKVSFECAAVIRMINYKVACREALRNWKIEGRQYYVIKGRGLRFLVICSKQKDSYNRVCKKLGVKKIDFYSLIKDSYFVTPSGTTKARHNIK